MRAIFTEVFEDVTKQGRKLQTSEYKENGKYAIIDQGQNDIAGYTDEEDGVVATVTQTDGKISVTHKKVGVADLADEVFVFYCGNATGYADDMKSVNI